MINFDDDTKENVKKHNWNWPEIPDHQYSILIVRVSGSGKTNALLNLINHEPDIDKIYLYEKDPYEAKYQFSINNRESTGLKYLNDSKVFIKYSNNICTIFIKILKNTIQIINDMIADMDDNERLWWKWWKFQIKDKFNKLCIFIHQI